MKVDLVLTCSAAEVRPLNYKKVEVRIEDIGVAEILGHISLSDAIDHYGDNTLLNEIGIDRVKEYFNLQDSKED